MKFTESHEWIKVSEGVGTVGVTDHAQHELGDIVHVELPEVGEEVKAGEEGAVIESIKAAADVYSPVSGTILEVNESLSDESELVNSAAESNGWLFKVKLTDPSEIESLMDKAAYDAKFS